MKLEEQVVSLELAKELKEHGYTSKQLNEIYFEDQLTLNEKEIEDKWLHVLITNKENMRWTE